MNALTSSLRRVPLLLEGLLFILATRGPGVALCMVSAQLLSKPGAQSKPRQ